MRRDSDTQPGTVTNDGDGMHYDKTRPKPAQCLHNRDKYTPWSTVGLTIICSLCLMERCTICHQNMHAGYYAKHQDSNCANR